ncbi:MAG: CDP-alcohol phosphatidyltransferase family protein [Deinococcota bacterium]|nr:CDP-alcohol phosphatidyltransferase family protein [Deinococcota bacterium]
MSRPTSKRQRALQGANARRGYVAHIYTASTVFFIALSAQLILQGRYTWALLMMAVTVIIDATDGSLARKLKVKETAPSIDGRRLDDIIDYVSYVFLPMLFALETGLLAPPAAAFAALAMFASAFGFSRTSAKLDAEGFFLGFPSYWNIVVFYLYLFETPPLLNTLIVLGLALMVFVPLRYLYLTRLPRHRPVNYVLALVWSALCLLALFWEPGPVQRAVLFVSLLYPAYYFIYSMILDFRSRAAAKEAH